MDVQLVVSRDAIASLDARVADIDKLISDQLSAVMHTPEFRSWKAPGAASSTWSKTARPAPTSRSRSSTAARRSWSRTSRTLPTSTSRSCSRRSTRRSTAPRSEEHTSELQSLMRISYAVLCLKKKKKHTYLTNDNIHNTKKQSSNK